MTDPAVRASGEIETPNPIELFWEKNRKWVTVALLLGAVAIGANYGIEYLSAKKRDSLWSEVATSTRLDQGYAADAEAVDLLSNTQLEQSFGGRGRMLMFYQNMARTELVTGLRADLQSASDAELATALKQTAGTPAEPLVLWAMAVRAVHDQDEDAAARHLDDLEQRFPGHFLCAQTAYPPQYREAEKKEDEPEKPEPPTSSNSKPEPPVLQPAVAGSPVSLLRAQIAADREFEAAHPEFYHAPEPAAEPIVVMKLMPLDREIRIRFYREHAPQHVANFLERVRNDYYNGLRIDQVERPGTVPGATENATQLHFGLAASRDNDRTKWTESLADPSEDVQDFEDNTLSHFPGMVAAASEAEGKSSGERVWINASDAVRFDGERVIFGRVEEADLEVIEQICGMSFADLAMDDQGRGQLSQNITIERAWVEGEPDEPPAPPSDNEVPKEPGGEEGK